MIAKILCAAAVLALATGLARSAENSAAVDLAQRVCATCHGTNGLSVSPTFPNLAGQPAEYLEVQLKAFRDRTRGDPHGQAFMWGMAAQLSDATIKDLAEYFATKQPSPGTPGGAQEVAAGKKIYEEGIAARDVPACVTCHGEKAEGQAAFPRLGGQHRDYLEQQLAAFKSKLRANEIMHENSKNLTALQISQVAAYLASLP